MTAANTPKIVDLTDGTYAPGVVLYDATGAVSTSSSPASAIAQSGEVQGSATAAVLPTLACRRVYLRARSDNAGNVYLGKSTVTKPDGTTDTTTGFELAAGDAIVLDITNLNLLYRICDNAGDDLTYLAFA